MTFRITTVRQGVLLGATALLTTYGCSQANDGHHAANPDKKEVSTEALLGGVSVGSKSLDAVGALGFTTSYGWGGIGGEGGTGGWVDVGGSSGSGGEPTFDGGGGVIGVADAAPIPPSFDGGCPYGCYTSFSPVCGGTLVGPRIVLTSRSCAASFDYQAYGATAQFAIGSNAYNARRRVDIVDVVYPPSGDDYAIVHLAEAVTDVTPFPLADLESSHVDMTFAALGYGSASNGVTGDRRAAALTLRGLSGKVYEFAFGSFDAFYEYERTHYYYPGTGGAGGYGGSYPIDAGQVVPRPAFDAGGPIDPGPIDPSTGGTGFGGSGGTDDWQRAQLLYLYENTLLGASEAYLGGAEGDGQPCYGDFGSPLLRKLDGQVRLFGVLSRLPISSPCERGAIYTRVSPELRAFVTQELAWKDPCEGISRLGRCEGTVAVRCTSRDEGTRRVVRLDCDLLAQTCVAPPDSEVICSDPE